MLQETELRPFSFIFVLHLAPLVHLEACMLSSKTSKQGWYRMSEQNEVILPGTCNSTNTQLYIYVHILLILFFLGLVDGV
jgi:hypothetical protein